MNPFLKHFQVVGAAWLLGAALVAPAAAVEPEVELRCEFRPTRAAVAAAEASRFHTTNANRLRDEIADELAVERRAERLEFSVGPTPDPVAPARR
jgi:hypothetical protein